MLKTKIPGLLRLFRFELPFTAGVCVLLGELLALGRLPTISQMVLGFLSVFFISASSLILNDYFDLETDRINAPGRPLPSGLVTGREGIALFCVVTLLGFCTSFLLGLEALLVGILVWMVGFLYNWRFKKTGLPGNLMVSFSVGMTFIFGGIAVGQPLEKVVWLFGVMAMLINLGEEIAADAMDIEGDKEAGSRSLPVLLGGENALKISASIFTLACIVSCLPLLFGWMEWVYVFPILLMDGIIIFATIQLLNASLVNRRMFIRWIYLGALLAIGIIIIMKMFR
jgi:geranylgeranylglycerol-phosphate geranylgeranyltransferase